MLTTSRSNESGSTEACDVTASGSACRPARGVKFALRRRGTGYSEGRQRSPAADLRRRRASDPTPADGASSLDQRFGFRVRCATGESKPARRRSISASILNSIAGLAPIEQTPERRRLRGAARSCPGLRRAAAARRAPTIRRARNTCRRNIDGFGCSRVPRRRRRRSTERRTRRIFAVRAPARR